jgi:hypothetical protein
MAARPADTALHVASLLNKLGVNSRAQVAALGGRERHLIRGWRSVVANDL